MSYDLDVTADVREFVADPASNFGWAAETEPQGDEVDIISHDNTDPPLARPRLTITYRLDPGDNARLSPMMSVNSSF